MRSWRPYGLTGKNPLRMTVFKTKTRSWLGGVAVGFGLVFAGWAFTKQPQLDLDRVWTIGTDNTLPYHALVEVPGMGLVPKGIAGELVAAAARRAGVKLAWLVLPANALSEGKVDLWPLNTITGPSPSIRVTRPFLRNSYVVVSRQPEWADRQSWAHLRQVLFQGAWVRSFVGPLFPRAQFISTQERAAALSALCSGEAEVLVVEARPLQALLLNRPLPCVGAHLYISGIDVVPTSLGIGSTNEAAPVAAQLRNEIDAMIEDGTVTLLLKDWAFYSSSEVDLIYREASARGTKRTFMILLAALAVLAVTLLTLFLRLRVSRRAAHAADAAKSAFLANMSHEIRTPLNGILGLAEVLSRSSLAAEQKDLLAMIRSSGQNLLCIVNDVLDLARVARREFELQSEPFDPVELIDDSLRPFYVVAREKGLEFRVAGLHTLPQGLLGDAVRLRQILVNLVGNAIKFTQQGEVTIQVAARPDILAGRPVSRVEIRVQDTGIGIAEDTRARLFEKFYQADTSISRRFGGTGLGLSIVKELISAMQGKITIESVVGRGSCFEVSIPMPIAPAAVVAEVMACTELEEDVGPHTATILLVEDNAVNQIVAQSLLGMAGYRVEIAANGLMGVAAWQRGSYDAILMDCQMPEMDGYEATAEIRKCEAGKSRVPIIALTASAMVGERERCLAAGMDDFLSKPIQAAELQRVLANWLGQAKKGLGAHGTRQRCRI